jgi:hypothetical protein
LCGLDRPLRTAGYLVAEGHFQLCRERFPQLHGLHAVDDDVFEVAAPISADSMTATLGSRPPGRLWP